MCTNVMTSLAGDLQNLSSGFRQGQSQYLQRIRGREEKKRQFFGDSELLMQEETEAELDYYDKVGTQRRLLSHLARAVRETEAALLPHAGFHDAAAGTA